MLRVYAISRRRVKARVREASVPGECARAHLESLQSERSLPAGLSQRPPVPYLGFDPRQGREVLVQAEPYQKWHSYAFRDSRCLKKPWKREHRCEYMHERPNCRSKFPEQTRPFAFPGEGLNIIRLISEEMERGARKRAAKLKASFAYRPDFPMLRIDGKYIIAITPFNPINMREA